MEPVQGSVTVHQLFSELERITGSQTVVEDGRYDTPADPWHLFMMGSPPDYELLAGNLLSNVKVLKRKDDTGKPKVNHPKVGNKYTERTDKNGLKPDSHSSSVVHQSD